MSGPKGTKRSVKAFLSMSANCEKVILFLWNPGKCHFEMSPWLFLLIALLTTLNNHYNYNEKNNNINNISSDTITCRLVVMVVLFGIWGLCSLIALPATLNAKTITINATRCYSDQLCIYLMITRYLLNIALDEYLCCSFWIGLSDKPS